MTEEEFNKEVAELVEMLQNLRNIRDKGERKKMKREIKYVFNYIIRD